MNIMNKLTLQHIKKNKTKTIVTIIGIIISVAMLTAVTTGMKSGMMWLRDTTIAESGKWHMEYKDVSYEKFKEFSKEDKVEEAFASEDIGYAKLKEAKNEDKPYVYIQALTDTAFKNFNLKLEEGRFPQNDTEIVISKHMLEDGGADLKVGDTVTYEIGERYVESKVSQELLEQNGISATEPLNQDNIYLSGYRELSGIKESGESVKAKPKEILKLTGDKKTYKVVGIISRPSVYMEQMSAPGYSVYGYIDQNQLAADCKLNTYIYYKKVSTDLYKEAVQDAISLGVSIPKDYVTITEETTIDELPASTFDINQDVLYYEGISPDSGLNTFILLMYIFLIIIVIIGSVSLIYNSFAISLSERSKQLGMLSSVGATKSQKRNSVFFEAFIYAVIGIPLGIISGIVGLFIAFQIVSPMITNAFTLDVPLKLYVSPLTVVISALLAVVTILISAYIPAIRASRISPMEAIRQSKDLKITKKKVKTSRLTKKLFGFEGELALKNMKRNKKRYRAITFSLFISVVLFLSVSSYIYYMTAAYSDSVTISNYDISISMYGEEEMPIVKAANKLEQMPGVTTATASKYMSFTGDSKQIQPYMTEALHEWINRDIKEGNLPEDFEYELMVRVYGMDEESYEAYCKEIGGSPSTTKKQLEAIVVNKIETKKDYSVKSYAPFSFKKNTSLTLTNRDAIDDSEKEKSKVEVSVAAETDKLPVGIAEYPVDYSGFITMVVPLSAFDEMVDTMEKNGGVTPRYSQKIYLKTEENTATADIKNVLAECNIDNGRYELYNFRESAQRNRQLVYAVSIFAYGFITLMSLICCANMCNTISTSIALRRSEFAMLKSVGMTPKRFHRMIMFESLLYGVKALGYGLPVGIGLSYLLYRFVVDRFTVGFILPAYIYIMTVVLVFVIVGLAMFYSSRKVRKENIIDGLKTDLV